MNAQSSDPPQEAVQILVDNHRQFRNFLERRVGNRSDAEEILQSAFVKSVEKSHAIRDSESAVAWFYRVLRNAVIDHYRSKGAERRAIERQHALFGDEQEPQPEFRDAICECVYRLLPTIKSEYADLLLRVDLEGTAIEEIASDSGQTANNVRVRLHRARASLRNRLLASCGACAEHGCLDCSCGGPAGS